jgi:hypothetical protein
MVREDKTRLIRAYADWTERYPIASKVRLTTGSETCEALAASEAARAECVRLGAIFVSISPNTAVFQSSPLPGFSTLVFAMRRSQSGLNPLRRQSDMYKYRKLFSVSDARVHRASAARPNPAPATSPTSA